MAMPKVSCRWKRMVQELRLLRASCEQGRRSGLSQRDATWGIGGDSSGQVISQLEFSKEVRPIENADYKWLLDYARLLWDECNKTFASLDEKAENIIRYLGGGTGLFAF